MDWDRRWNWFWLGFFVAWWTKPALQRLWLKFNAWLDEKANIS